MFALHSSANVQAVSGGRVTREVGSEPAGQAINTRCSFLLQNRERGRREGLLPRRRSHHLGSTRAAAA